MNTIPGNITQLALGKKEGEPLTQEEQEICEEWITGKAEEYMKADVDDPMVLEYLALYIKWKERTAEVWEGIVATRSRTEQQEIPVMHAGTRRIGKRLLLAAAVLAGLIAGVYLLLNVLTTNKNQEPGQQTAVINKPIVPGKEKAFLTLDDNKQIDLDTIPAGIIAYQDQMEISKEADNQIVYKVSDNHKAGTRVLNNSLTTPYGGEYKVTLADGSTVWLNAGSSLRYPAVFTGNDRPVTITGEGYFEVAENKAKPFRVFANGTEVKVLGTKFNVKAYERDKQVTATLVSGAVAIQHGSILKNIKPNQQAIVSG
ncbi:MAG TPA: FecR family protein, partial [Niastella sp.]